MKKSTLKFGKYDVTCRYCHQIIKGALRETMGDGDYEGTICSDNESYWHFKCKKR